MSSKEEFKKQILSGVNETVELPMCYWIWLLEKLDEECDVAALKIKGLSSAFIKEHSSDNNFQMEFASPFIMRAMIVEDLVEKGYIDEEMLYERGFEWVDGLFSQNDDSDSKFVN